MRGSFVLPALSPPSRRRPSLLLRSASRASLLLGSLLVLASTGLGPGSARAWTQNQFVIGTFWDPCHCTTCTPSDTSALYAINQYRQAKDAYFNLLTGLGPKFREKPVQEIDRLLDYAYWAGISYMAADNRLFDAAEPNHSEPDYVSIRGHYMGLSAARRSALFGYYLWEEPHWLTPELPQWPNHDIVKGEIEGMKQDTEKLSYVNLYPWNVTKTRVEYESYVDDIVNDPNPARRPDVVAFDYYPFDSATVSRIYPSDQPFKTNYFKNLQIIREKAGSRPFWTHMMSIRHNEFTEPTEEQIRFMAMCPIAYGSKGLIYFTYSVPPGFPDWSTDAIVSKDNCNLVQPKYDWIKRLNEYVTKVAAPVVFGSTNLGGFHKSSLPTGEVLDPPMLLDANTPLIADLSNPGTMVGVFRDNADTQTYYVLLVNKWLTRTTTAGVTLRGSSLGSNVSRAPSMVNYAGDVAYLPQGTVVSVADNTTSFLVNLEGGEGRFFKITGVTSPNAPVGTIAAEWIPGPVTQELGQSEKIPRWDASLIYDSVNNRYIRFGGNWTHADGTGHNIYRDVWSYTPDSARWVPLAFAGSPPNYWEVPTQVAVYDPGPTGTTPRMLVTNGRDVWSLTLTGTPTWSSVPTTFPGETSEMRNNFVAVLDTDRRDLVVFGGTTTATPPPDELPQPIQSTWRLHLDTSVWEKLADYPNLRTERCGGVYDPHNQRLLIFGGSYPDYCPQVNWHRKVFALGLASPSSWVELPGNGPWRTATDFGAVWDVNRDRAMVFGGYWYGNSCNLVGPCGSFSIRNEWPTDEVWTMDGATGAWSRSYPAGTRAGVRGRHAMAFSAARDEVLVFGGGEYTERVISTPCQADDFRAYRSDSWVLNPDVVPPAATGIAADITCEDVTVTWTSPGDDGMTGNAKWYQVRNSNGPITEANFFSLPIFSEGVPLSPGSVQTASYSPGPCSPVRYYALKVRDEKAWSPITVSMPVGTACPGPGQMCEEVALSAVPARADLDAGPMPVRSAAAISYSLPSSASGRAFDLAIFDVTGRRIRRLASGSAKPGAYQASWELLGKDGARIDSGIYFVRLRIDEGAVLTDRIVVTH